MSIASIIANRDHTIISCRPQDSMQTAAKLLADKRIGALPVLDQGKVVGIFSERDLLYCIAKDGADSLRHAIGDVMTAPAITIGPDTEVLQALSMMTKRRIRHLPVVEDEKLVGFVSIGDLVKYRMDRIETEAQQMRDYITAA